MYNLTLLEVYITYNLTSSIFRNIFFDIENWEKKVNLRIIFVYINIFQYKLEMSIQYSKISREYMILLIQWKHSFFYFFNEILMINTEHNNK